MVLGVDLVAAQLRLALAGEMPAFPSPEPRGSAVECRVCAEDPSLGFAPSAGRLLALEVPRAPGSAGTAGASPGTR